MLPCEGQHHTIFVFMQKAIIKYKELSIIVIVVLHFNNRGMFERYWSDMPQRRGMSDHSGGNHILRYIFQNILDN